LPDLDGFEVIHQLREWTSMSMVVLSVRSQEGNKVRALDAGADDYMTKPLGGELLAYVRVVLRHTAKAAQELDEPIFTISDLTVDLTKHQVFRGNTEVHPTPMGTSS